MRVLSIISLLLVCLSGCTTVSTNPRPDNYYSAMMSDPAAETGSLFSGDSAVLSDADIAKILDYRYEAPELGRVAIMTVGGDRWSQWSEEMAVATERMRSEVIDKLEGSPRVYDASFLPSVLVPEKQTVPHLREAAARYQADLLLIYRSYCRSFEKYRLFSADRSKAYCGVEAVLLDARTGLVPYTSLSTRAFTALETKEDTNFRETVMKAQLNAVTDALGEVSDGVVGFLASE
ncbi:MAG: hypothetical protein KJO82_11540 [Gammaproteobacteria bacterium]|nr:hypothetical protein [Gammaproteobacteria bacterium]